MLTIVILRFPEYPKKPRADIIIETMRFRWKSYRLEKAEIIPLMETERGNISHVKHDFHFPSDLNQSERDARLTDILHARIETRVKGLATAVR